nr:MAG TPA: hypothetical protein [Caudoviricetes sp.]
MCNFELISLENYLFAVYFLPQSADLFIVNRATNVAARFLLFAIYYLILLI